MPDCIPFLEPGQNPTCRANGAITGCRFVQIKTGVNAVDGLPQVETCGAGLEAFGVAARDKLTTEAVMVYKWGHLPVLAGAALSHGQKVQSDAQGRAIPLAGGVELGTVMADAADATLAEIDFRPVGARLASDVVGDQAAVTSLANNTGVVGDDAVANVPAVAAADAAVVTDVMLTDATVDAAGVNAQIAAVAASIIANVQATVDVVEADIADLTDKLNVVIDRLEAAGLLTP